MIGNGIMILDSKEWASMPFLVIARFRFMSADLGWFEQES